MAHGFTYSGHPVAAAVSIRNIELIEELDLVGETGRKTAAYFQAKLATLNDHPLVGQTRGVGLLGALELVKDKRTRQRYQPDGSAGAVCRTHCFETGIVMRAVGDTMFLCPPLVITKAEIDELFALVRTSLDKSAAELEQSHAS
jgi:putrescine aminotransferase